MMNREIRRAQAKQDKKAEREKEERRAARRRKVEQLRSRRATRRAEIRAKSAAGASAKGAESPADASAAPTKRRGRAPGRFSGALMIATVFFIVLQSSVPPEASESAVLRTVTGTGFFLLFGYFSVMWLMRREVPRPLFMTWITGAMLVGGVEVAKAIQGVVPIDPLMIALSLPAIVAGSYLGRLVYENTPS
jgi:hypothetical protein